MKRLALGIGFCTLTAMAGEYQSLQRIWATETAKIEAAMERYPRAFQDGFIIAAFPETIKVGPEAVRKFENQQRFAEHFQQRGVPVQICISSTLGHHDGWTVPGDYPKMVGSDGTVTKAMACPRAPAFIANICARASRHAALHPKVIWLDDDFRIPSHQPADIACFCPDCVQAFNTTYGFAFDRAALVTAICSDAIVNGVNVRDVWSAYASKALTDLAAAIAKAVHEVDDSVAIGFMVCNLSMLRYGGPDFKRWIEVSRNRDGAVYFRPGSGCYTDERPYSSDGVVAKNIQIGRLCAATEGPGVVNLTEEVTCPYTRRAKSMRMTYLECALNLAFAGADGTTFDAIKPNLDEQLSPGAVVDMLNSRRGDFEWIHGRLRGLRQIGVAVPETKPRRGPVASIGELCHVDESAVLAQAFNGVPLTFRPGNACCSFKDLNRADLPARVDAAVRMGLSLWESPKTGERLGFVWNFGYDDVSDARLVLAGDAGVSVLALTGEDCESLGTGRAFTLPSIPAWSFRVVLIKPLAPASAASGNAS